MKILTALLVLSLSFASAARAQPAPAGAIVITENAVRQATQTSIRAREVLVSPQVQSASGRTSKTAAAAALGFAGLLLGSWLGDYLAGGGEQGVQGAIIGAGAGALVGVMIAMK